jgi:hypothetical protein
MKDCPNPNRAHALTPPHFSVIPPRLDQPSCWMTRMKRGYHNQKATAAQPMLDERRRMEGVV